MKYVIGKKNAHYGITNDRAVCEVLDEYTCGPHGEATIRVRVLYRRDNILFEEYSDTDTVFPVRKSRFREIKDADSYIKRYNSKALKNVPNKKRLLEIMDINKELSITDGFPF